jgi:hypothetical protein
MEQNSNDRAEQDVVNHMGNSIKLNADARPAFAVAMNSTNVCPGVTVTTAASNVSPAGIRIWLPYKFGLSVMCAWFTVTAELGPQLSPLIAEAVTNVKAAVS